MVMLRRIHTSSRFLLTGTPVQNNMSEMWSLMNFLLPEIFDEPVSILNFAFEKPESEKLTIEFSLFKEVFERYFEIDSIGNSNLSFKEEQERSVLSIFHQVNFKQNLKKRHSFKSVFVCRFLFHLFYAVEKLMLIYIYHLKKK